MLATTHSCMFSGMEKIGSRITAAREKKGLNQSELGRLLGVSPQSVQAWESDKNVPRPRRLADIAAALNLDLGDLLRTTTRTGDDFVQALGEVVGAHSNLRKVAQPHRDAKEYPLISWVAAGCWEESCDNFAPGDADEWLTSNANAGDFGYWLEVNGPSMQPTFTHGMRILVKPENFDLISGKYYIAKLLDTGETTFKQYLRDGGQSFLQPLNPAFPVIPVTDNVAIIGYVIDAKLPPIF